MWLQVGGTKALPRIFPTNKNALLPQSSFDLGIRLVIIYKALSCTLLPMLSLITIIYALTHVCSGTLRDNWILLLLS